MTTYLILTGLLHVMKQFAKITLILYIGCLLAINPALAGGNFAVPVQVEEAIEEKIAPVVWMPATVISRFDSKIASEVDGLVEEVVDVGDRLKKGDVIARIDSLTIELRKREIESEILPIEAKLEFYKREVERLSTLAEKNNAAKNRLDEMMSERELNIGQIKIIKSRLAQVNDQLKRCIIRAPFSGIVTERFTTHGERVEMGDNVIRLVNTEALEIQARIPSSSIRHLKIGNELLIQDERQVITGKIKTLIPVGDDLSRLYELRLDFSNENWMAGYAVRIAVPTAPKQTVVAVPRDALVIRESGNKVYRVDANGIAEAVSVITGVANLSHIQIKGGIHVGDKIIVRGNERIRPGQKVDIKTFN